MRIGFRKMARLIDGRWWKLPQTSFWCVGYIFKISKRIVFSLYPRQRAVNIKNLQRQGVKPF